MYLRVFDSRDRSFNPEPSPAPRPYGTRLHVYTGPLVITLHLVCDRFLSSQDLAHRVS